MCVCACEAFEIEWLDSVNCWWVLIFGALTAVAAAVAVNSTGLYYDTHNYIDVELTNATIS